MTKVVINVCYGGFGLSHEAMCYYAKLKGIKVYPEKGEYGMWDYWVMKDHVKSLKHDDFMKLTHEQRTEYNQKRYDQTMEYDGSIGRDDPALIQTVEELGKKSWGDCAELKIVEIPDGIDWYIHEYDGSEHVAVHHRTWS